MTLCATNLPAGLSLSQVVYEGSWGYGLIGGAISSNADVGSPYAVTLTATDIVTGESDSQTFSWTVLQPTVTLTSPGAQNNFDGDVVSLPVYGSENASHDLTYSATGWPAGLHIDRNSGVISGAIASNADASGPYSVTVTATDTPANVSSSQTFSWAIAQPVVTLTGPGDQSNYDGDTVSVGVSASDSANHALTFTESGLPSGLGINSNGVTTGNLASNADQSGPYTVTVTATDAAANVSATQTFNWAIAQPVVTLTPADQSNYDGDAVSLSLAARDTATSHALTYGITSGTLPSGLSLDSSTGVISGAIASNADQDGPYSVTVTATDTAADVSASHTLGWAVAQPTVTLSVTPLNNYDGDYVSTYISATEDAGHSLTYSADNLPTGLTMTSYGYIYGTIDSAADAQSPYTVTVTATDAAGGASDQENFTWTVTKPTVILSVTPLNNYDGDYVSTYISATEDAGHSLTYTADNLPAGLTMTSYGLIYGTIASDADQGGPYTVTVKATDSAADVSASQAVSWAVVPDMILAQTDQSNSDGDTVSVGGLYFWESAPDTVTFSATGLPSGLSINSASGVISGTIAYGASAGSPYSVSITASDSAANAAVSVSISWDVNPLDVQVLYSADKANLPGDNVSLAPLYAFTSDGSALTYVATGLPAGLSIDPNSGTITGAIDVGAASNSPYQVTVTATQPNADVSVSQTINWTVSQLLLSNPGQQRNLLGDTVSVPTSASDAFINPVAFSAVNLPDGLSIDPDSGTISGIIASGAAVGSPYSVTVTATDGSASATQTFTWTVNPIALHNPGSQFSMDGDAVNLTLNARAANGDPMTFTASGLPPGAAIDPSSGVISGTIAANAGSGGPYSVTVSATDANTRASVSRTFAWNIAPAAVAGTIQYFPLGASLVISQPAPGRTWGQWGEIAWAGPSSLIDSQISIWQGAWGVTQATAGLVTGNSNSGQASMEAAYNRGPLGQTEGQPVAQGIVLGSLGVATGAMVVAGGVIAIEAAPVAIAATRAAATALPRITFRHGARHLAGTGLAQTVVEAAISAHIRALAVAGTLGTQWWGWVQVNGQWIQYRAFVLPDGTINVGTYVTVAGNLMRQ